jgi:hypothetical protein
MASRDIHVLDPRCGPYGYNQGKKDRHELVASCLHDALFQCFHEFFAGWPIKKTDWGTKFQRIADTNYSRSVLVRFKFVYYPWAPCILHAHLIPISIFLLGRNQGLRACTFWCIMMAVGFVPHSQRWTFDYWIPILVSYTPPPSTNQFFMFDRPVLKWIIHIYYLFLQFNIAKMRSLALQECMKLRGNRSIVPSDVLWNVLAPPDSTDNMWRPNQTHSSDWRCMVYDLAPDCLGCMSLKNSLWYAFATEYHWTPYRCFFSSFHVLPCLQKHPYVTPVFPIKLWDAWIWEQKSC